MHNILHVNATHWLTTYPETLPSCIAQLAPRLPARDGQLASLRPAVASAQSTAMDELQRRLLWGYLQALGLFRDQTPMDVDPSTGLPHIGTGLLPLYDRWFAASLAVLKDFFRRDGQSVVVADPTPLDLDACWRAWDEHKASWLQDDSQQALIALVEPCLRALPEILTGKRLATDVIFPDGSMHLVEGVYTGRQGADYFNGVLADTAAAYVKERLARDPAAEIRILEIGAGTGGTAAAVLPALAPFTDHIRDYCYTDISQAFLRHAEVRFVPAHPFLTMRIFDVSRPIDGQGLEPDHYDVVIAANVLHATKNIRQTLHNAKAPLRKHGLLLLNELNGTPLIVHLTFGLLAGWWSYDDPALRMPGNPGLAPHTWQRVLEEEGLHSVWFPAEAAHDLGQQIIIAESDGVVRQSRAMTAPATHGNTKIIPAAPVPRTAAANGPEPSQSATNAADVVTRAILDGLARALKISAESIDQRKPFSDYGLDSILGISFVKHLNDRLGIDLNTAILFDHTSVDRLARHVIRTHGDQIRSRDLTTSSASSSGQHTFSPVHDTRAGAGHEHASPALAFVPYQPWSHRAKVQRRWDEADDHVGIAVIGMSGQFPEAGNVEIFWQNLINGVDGVRELPSPYLNQELSYSPTKQPGKTYCCWGGILAERTYFDPLFFSISPREAESMSPHQRLILQEGWKSLEDAGYNPQSLADTPVGVFIGAEPTGYFHESFTGSSDAIVASRLSYYLDLKGPAMVINTGCSSSGVALHLACESLRHGESCLALAGGVFAALQHKMLIGLSAIDMLSPTGRCHTFDQAADGTAFSEGVGVVVLKRLEDAIADGDPIYGVIRGSGVNQDGASNGITAPSGSAQESLMVSVYERFGIDPERISYVEAHGTGTRLGDPVEANALVRAFRRFTARQHYCTVGSAKAHIGHTAASAGVIGLIKVLLSLKHHRVPGLLHFTALNPLIEFDGSPFYVPTQTQDWRSMEGKPLMAALNSFGHSGTNAHLVVEEYIPAPPSPHPHRDWPVVVPLSAQTEEALLAYAAALAHFLQPATAPAAAPVTAMQLQQMLAAMVASILAVAPQDIDPFLPLADYGMTWGHLMALRQRLQDAWQVDADLKALSRCGSLAEVVEYLLAQHRDAFADLSAAGTPAEVVSAIDLEALAYTLQVGREAMKYRVAFLARDVAELHERLAAVAQGVAAVEGCWRTEVSPGKHDVLVDGEVVSQPLVTQWLSEGRLDKVAEAWTRGAGVDWPLFYGEERPRRLHLPTYPFARERYEAAENRAAAAEAAAVARITVGGTDEAHDHQSIPAPATDIPGELLTFEEVWEEQGLDQSHTRLHTMLCFVSDPAHQQALRDLAHRHAPDTHLIFVVREKHGRDQASALPPDASVLYVNPLAKSSYTQAFARLKGEGTHVDALLYLWADEDATLVPNPAPLVYLLQAMAETKLGVGRILLGARCDAASLERCYLEAWIGLERSLGLVWPQTPVVALLDETGDRSLAIWLERLWTEISAATPTSVLYRHGRRHVCHAQATTLAPGNGTPLRTGGTYLITGGCGALGLLVARHLAETRAANLILTGRSPLDASRRAAIERLEALGGQAFYIPADVCDAGAMAARLNEVRQRYGAIHGVIHAAGVQSVGTIFEKSVSDFQQVLDPKVTGTLVLDQVLRDDDLDFISYFSSSAAMLGDFGACDYAMANRFQMAHAAWHNMLVARGERRGRAITVHWPLWRDGGMGFRGDAQAENLYLKSSGQRALRPSEGLDLFERILGQAKTQHLVLVGEPERIRGFLGARQNAPAPASTPTGAGRRAEMKGLTVPQCVAWDLADLTSQLLRIPRHRLDAEANLADFGFDSISLSEFAAVLTTHFTPAGLGAAITLSLFFGHPTLGLLAQYFMNEHSEAMHAFYHAGDDTTAPIQMAQAVCVTPTLRGPTWDSRALATSAAAHDEPIAIIGMSGRFPQARNVAEMWNLLAQGREAVTEIPPDRFDWRLYYGDAAAGRTDGKWCGCVPGVREFDPLFFEISPREAEAMDPRQRLLLQEAWNALEDAGYGRKHIEANRIGMFVGAEQGDYQQLAGMAGGVTASHNAVLAARLAYFLNLRGPNMAIDTACSSGLVAAHQACLSLRAGECTTAIVAGVHLLLTPGQLVGMTGAGMLSPDGRCYAFDQRANGLVPGEAVAVVVLKRLSQAEADGDPIHAVISGSGVNYDGKTHGLTAPNAEAQADLLNTVYARFDIDPAAIEYVVSHGTGTRLGDPIEIHALESVFKSRSGQHGRGYCALTSCKPNFGHTFAASGLVSLIALVQAIRHRTIPASLHCEQESAYVDWQDSPFYVNKQVRAWTSERRTGAVSAFGMSGTNAHMIVRSYDGERESNPARAPYYLLTLSAKTADGLQRKFADMVAWLENTEAPDLASISYTLLESRWQFRHRCAVVIQARDDAIQVWRQMLSTPDTTRPNLFREEVPRDFTPRRVMQQLALDLLERCRMDAEPPGQGHEPYQENLLALADLYCQGYDLPWMRMFPAGMRRIGLPTYPFSRAHYWVSEPAAVPAVSSGIATEPAVEEATGTLMLQACWNPQDIAQQVVPPEYGSRLVIFCDLPLNDPIEVMLKRRLTVTRCRFLQASAQDIAARFESYAVQILAELQPLIAGMAADRATTHLLQVVVSNRDEAWPLTGLAGLLQTARLEHPTLASQLIAVDPELDAEALAGLLERESWAPWESRVRYRGGQRQVAGWREIAATGDPASPPWRQGATYLITGGAGGLGRLIAEDIVARTTEVNVILTGRSASGADAWPTLRGEAALNGARIVYRQADVTDTEAVTTLVREVEREFGGLNGIIHAAGIARDNAIRHKQAHELRDVLAPKVAGLMHLDQATRHLDLDFLVCFSSMTAALGNPGQADYAAANAFMDAYAAYRNSLVAAGRRRGLTLSINWPLWRQGGMVVTGHDGAWETQMRQHTGLISMSTATGLQALYQALAIGGDQILVAEGEVPVIRQRLFPALAAARSRPDRPAEAAPNKEQLREHTIHQLRQLLADYLKLDAAQIDAQEPLEAYGIDSIMIRQLNAQLAGVFGKLPATLFYEHQTLLAVAEHLVTDHEEACARWGCQACATPSADVPVHAASGLESAAPLASEPTRTTRDSVRTTPEWQVASHRELIAIIGMSGRYPMAGNLDEYWQNLKAGRDCITEIPQDRWPLEGFYHPDKEEAVAQGKSYCKWGGFVERFAEFDCLFFNISPREALNMDPQERLFVEACWAVLEDAGYTRAMLAERHGNRVGVFAGITKTGFDLYGPQMWQHGEKFSPHTSFASVANRVSYLLNLCGPSMPIDTMCSSSLTAVHEACEHLLRHECELAIAGGVNLYLHPTSYTGLCHQRMLSIDGHCKSFGMGGNGYVPGEGVGVVLLKPLRRAIADGDRIHAVIRATGINHDGKTNGYTVPNPKAQAALIRETLKKAGVSARLVSYLEAHGTGTDLGDPIEITGLNQAFRAWTSDTGFCAIGSVKSNIGHLEAAAGVAGLTKVVLQMQHGQLVPTLHVDELNPNIDFAHSPFLPQRELAPWLRPQIEGDGEMREHSRIAGVSSFGAGGANAHVILEEYREPAEPVVQEAGDRIIRQRLATMIVLSARKEDELQARARQLLGTIAQRPLTDTDLACTAYTLQAGREAMEERLALTAGSIAELREKLQLYVSGRGDLDGLMRGRVEKAVVAEFAADKERSDRMQDRLRQGEIDEVLGYWVKGLDIDWHRLYGEQPPRRIDLPTYPFAGKRFWLPGSWDRGIHQPATLPQLPQGATAESRGEQPGVKVNLQRHASVGGRGEVVTRPKPRGIVLTPLNTVQPTETHPHAARSSVASQEADAQPALASQAVGHPPTIPSEILHQTLAASLAEALFLEYDEIVFDKPFIDMGLDSIVAAEWVRALNTRYSINITVSRVYDYPNIMAFATFLETVLAKRQASAPPGETMSNEGLTIRVEAATLSGSSRAESGTVRTPGVPDSVELPPVANMAVTQQPSGADEALCQDLVASLAEALFLERVEVVLDKPFLEMGLDSIVAAEWIRAINAQYGTNITVTKIYDHPTILALATFMRRELGAQAPATERINLEEVLHRVQQGHLEIAQAYQLLQQIDAS